LSSARRSPASQASQRRSACALRTRNGQSSRSPAWLNVLGILFALAAFLGDLLNLRAPLVESLALGAVASFGVSGLLILRSFRKGLAAK